MNRIYHSAENQKLLRKFAEENGFGFLSDELLKKSLKDFIVKYQLDTKDIWVFGYGSPEKPGLMLGVEEKLDAVCSGVAFKIAKENIWQELYHYWQRELRFDAYLPVMVLYTLEGEQINMLTLVVNIVSSHYFSNLNIQQQAKMITTGEGDLEKNITYLNNLLVHLQEYGIEDDYLSKLQQAAKIVADG